MRKQLFKGLCVAALSLSVGSASAQWGRPEPEDPDGLKDAYKDYFKIGVAVIMSNLNRPNEVETILKEYNSITAENNMKPGEVHPKEGVWTWEKADSIANFARQHNIIMRGHGLVWHSQFCDWMFTDANG